MNLAVFDVDGTLARTVKVDSDCFVRAFAEEFKLTGINTNWAEYDHYTDSGIARQIFMEKLGHSPSPAEKKRLVDRFMDLLKDSWRKSPKLFLPLPGAPRAVERLKSENYYRIAIATGCWLDSARFKLDRAGISIADIPIASADDSIVREEIVGLAIKKSRIFYQVPRFDRTVYLGDGVWDVKITARLKLPFIGVGDKEKTKILGHAGARHFLSDFSDYELLLRKLDEATAPVIS